jgi:beta-lactamase regulating signal transducer with metallopeptidase domain
MTALVTWVWQGLVIVLAAQIVVRLCPRLNATTRHVIWWGALAMILVHPWTPVDVSFAPEVHDAAAPRASTAAASVLMLPPLPHPPWWCVVAAIGVWFAVALWRGSRIAASLHTIARLKRESTPAESSLEHRLPLWRALRASGRACTLRIGEQAAGPCALGFWRPAILIPRRVVDELSSAELDQVIAHEHAHLVRYDDWLYLVQCCISAGFGLHPAIWLIGPQLDLEREAACDDRVVAHTGAARAYADCLARVATLLVAHRQEAAAIAPAVTRSSPLLRTRVERLLNRRRNSTLRVGRLSATAAIAFLGVVVVACDQAPPLVVFGDGPADVSRAASLPVSATVSPAPLATSHVVEAAAPRRVRSESLTPRSAAPVLPAASVPITEAAPDHLLSAASITAPVPSPIAVPEAVAPPVAAPASEPHIDTPGDENARVAIPAAADSPAPPVDDSGGSWSNVGSTFARAGVSVGKGAQHAGQSVGRWFSRPLWAARKDSPQ